jgi:hypothetical protein
MKVVNNEILISLTPTELERITYALESECYRLEDQIKTWTQEKELHQQPGDQQFYDDQLRLLENMHDNYFKLMTSLGEIIGNQYADDEVIHMV